MKSTSAASLPLSSASLSPPNSRVTSAAICSAMSSYFRSPFSFSGVMITASTDVSSLKGPPVVPSAPMSVLRPTNSPLLSPGPNKSMICSWNMACCWIRLALGSLTA